MLVGSRQSRGGGGSEISHVERGGGVGVVGGRVQVERGLRLAIYRRRREACLWRSKQVVVRDGDDSDCRIMRSVNQMTRRELRWQGGVVPSVSRMVRMMEIAKVRIGREWRSRAWTMRRIQINGLDWLVVGGGMGVISIVGGCSRQLAGAARCFQAETRVSSAGVSQTQTGQHATVTRHLLATASGAAPGPA